MDLPGFQAYVAPDMGGAIDPSTVESIYSSGNNNSTLRIVYEDEESPEVVQGNKGHPQPPIRTRGEVGGQLLATFMPPGNMDRFLESVLCSEFEIPSTSLEEGPRNDFESRIRNGRALRSLALFEKHEYSPHLGSEQSALPTGTPLAVFKPIAVRL